jgi:ABC-2 type transport system ATP-binding protein
MTSLTASDAARPVIEASSLSKEAKGTRILSAIDLKIAAGQVFGLVGPSGCGKTTLVRLLVGLLKPSAGEVRLFGRDPTRFGPRERERLGYMPQHPVLYPTLSLQQNAHFVAALYGVGWLQRRRRVRDLLKLVELYDARGRPAGRASGGMQRRLSLVCAVAHQPEVLFADEPTAGLDPLLREKLWGYLRSWRDRGLTIILTTQHLDEINYCDTVGLMRDGRLIAVDTPEGLRRRAAPRETVEIEVPDEAARRALAALRRVEGVHGAWWARSGVVAVQVDDGPATTPLITHALEAEGIPVAAVQQAPPTFDEVFKELVSRPASTGKPPPAPGQMERAA